MVPNILIFIYKTSLPFALLVSYKWPFCSVSPLAYRVVLYCLYIFRMFYMI